MQYIRSIIVVLDYILSSTFLNSKMKREKVLFVCIQNKFFKVPFVHVTCDYFN